MNGLRQRSVSILSVDLIDPSDGSLLDRRRIDFAAEGVYYSWIVRGRICFQVSRLTGNAVLNGVFFDPLVVSSRLVRLNIRQFNLPEFPTLRLDLRGVPNYPYRIELSTNLVDWAPWQVQVASPSGRITILNAFDFESSAQFYRAILQH